MDRRSPRVASSPVSLRTDDPPARERSVVFRYGVAVVTTMVALVFKLALGPVILPSFYVPFYGAVLVSAWVGGVGPGIVASVLSFGIGQVLFSPPLAPPPSNAPLAMARDVLFLFVAIGWSWGTAALHASQRRVAEVLEAARDELEASVARRTAEVRETNRQLTDEMARRAEAEEQFHRAFQDAPIGIALVGLDGFPLRVNRALCAMLGYTEDELLGKSVADVTHPDDMPAARHNLLRLLAGEGASYPLEKRYIHKRGHIVWVSLNVSVVRDAAGAPLHVISQVEDISERKRAAELLRESEERFRGTFEQAAVGIAHVAPDGRWLRVNRRLCEIVGYTEAELLPRTFQDITHSDDLDADLGHVRDMLDGKIQTYSMEKRYVRNDGSEVWIDLTVSLVREPSGAPKYFISVVQDIGERKRAEAALRRAHEELEDRVEERTAQLAAANRALRQEIIQRREAAEALRDSEQRFRGIFDQAAVGVSQMGTDGRYLLVNQRMCDILGYSREELLERSFRDVTYPDDVEASVRGMHRVQANETESFSLEKRYIRKDGAVIWVNLTASAIRDPAGNVKYGIGIVEDISERKQAEEELVVLNKRRVDLLESITDGFFALDHEDRFTYLNPSAARMLARQRETLVGKNVWETFPDAAASAFYAQHQRVVSEQVALDVETYYPPLNRWFKSHEYPTRDGVSVLFEDVTERHEHEVRSVSDILHALNGHLRVDEAYEQVAGELQTLTGCDHSSLVLFDDDHEIATVVSLDQPGAEISPGTRLRLRDIPAAVNVLAGRPHVVPDLAQERQAPIIQTLYAAGVRSVLCVPLQGSRRVSGMLVLTWPKLDAANGVHLPLLGQIAGAVALAVEKERLFDEVRSGHERLQALSHRLLEVQEAERQHIARELHDEIGQLLTALQLTLDTIERVPPGAALVRVHDAQQLVNDLVTRVRDLSLDLRPAMLDDLGLLPALLWLIGRYSTQTSVRVRFEHSGLDRRFSADLETAAYRIVQEALTNVARHADVREATVRVWTNDRTLSVQVTDLGRGFDEQAARAAGTSGGLSGLYERGALLGGRLTVESAAGRGTRISAELPLADVS